MKDSLGLIEGADAELIEVEKFREFTCRRGRIIPFQFVILDWVVAKSKSFTLTIVID